MFCCDTLFLELSCKTAHWSVLSSSGLSGESRHTFNPATRHENFHSRKVLLKGWWYLGSFVELLRVYLYALVSHIVSTKAWSHSVRLKCGWRSVLGPMLFGAPAPKPRLTCFRSSCPHISQVFPRKLPVPKYAPHDLLSRTHVWIW